MPKQKSVVPPGADHAQALHALTRKYAEVAGLIGRAKAEVHRLTADLTHIEGAIRIFDPTIDIGRIKAKHVPIREPSAQGEVTGIILDTLRDSPDPLTPRELAEELMVRRALPIDDRDLFNIMLKRAIFYRRLLPLLAFGREREGVDLTGVRLTHHSLKDQGQRDLLYPTGETPKLTGVAEAGSGGLHEKEKALLDEIIARVNDLFEGDLTDDDKLVYVNDVIKGKLLESEELATQARNNTKAQFANSPTLRDEMMNAIMDALAAHQAMSKQALDSQRVRDDMKDVLLGPGQLYEALRDRSDH